MQRRQHVGRGLVALGDRLRRIAFDDALGAEILGDQKSRFEVGVADRGRGKAALAQPVCDRDERLDVLGQMHRGAVGFPVIDRRPIRPPRRIHQDDHAVVVGEPRIGARRGIARHALARRIRKARRIEKLPQRLQPLDLRGGLAVAGDLGSARGRSQRRTMAEARCRCGLRAARRRRAPAIRSAPPRPRAAATARSPPVRPGRRRGRGRHGPAETPAGRSSAPA